jgi:hypothetical protein
MKPVFGMRLKQISRGTVETHSMQINLFPPFKLESAIRAEWAVGFGIRRRWQRNGFPGIIQPNK